MGTSCVGLLLFMLCSFNLVSVELALANGTDTSIAKCPDSSCGNQVIRFPFRIRGRHPKQCGYPGFDLSCTSDNNTVIELPHSVKLNVKNIDYRHQTIELSDPHGCFFRQVQHLTLSSASHFQLKPGKSYRGYNFFNCSLMDRSDSLFDNYLVPCLNTSTSQVYAIPSTTTMEDLPLSFCTKIFNISYNPFDIQTDQDSFLHFTWSEPNCKHCESKGNRCGWKNHTANNQIFCFPKQKGSSSTALVTTGSVLGSLFSMLLIGTVYHICDSYRLKREKQVIFEKFLQDYRALKPTRYSYVEIKRITNNFEHKLGEGAFGSVFKGSISKEISIAVKILNISHGNGDDFINEVSTMGRIHHVNIVRLVGFCADGFKRAIVYEFLSKGSLQKFINSPDNKQNFLGWKRLHEIALGIAKGVEYLHQGCDQRILHFDIKPQNVLLDHNFAPKICDFGLAKLCSRDQSIVSMTAARGTLGYIAPEVFSRNFGNVSYKSDVYSYGMMLLETIGGKKITEDIEENTSHVYYPEWIHNLFEEHEEMRIHIDEEGDAEIAKKLAIVGLWCIQWHAMDRPSMQMVVQMLEGDVDTTPIPPNPFSSSAGAGLRRTSATVGVVARQLTQDLEVIQELE